MIAQSFPQARPRQETLKVGANGLIVFLITFLTGETSPVWLFHVLYVFRTVLIVEYPPSKIFHIAMLAIPASLAVYLVSPPLEADFKNIIHPSVVIVGVSVLLAAVVTYLKKIIEEKKLHEEKLVLEQQRTEEALKEKTTFLANMSHEIRTPMNGVLGLAEILMASDIDDEHKEMISSINDCGEGLLVILNDILDFSKLEAGKVILESVPFNINKCIQACLNVYEQKAAERGLHFSCNVSAGTPPWVLGDSNRLKQVLLNLIGNAVKFSENGSIDLQLETEKSGEKDLLLCFSIRDSGIGIAESKVTKLFESFNQADASTTREYGGTGLGLAISKGLVEAMGGEISVDSTLTKGSTFKFSIKTKAIKSHNEELSTNDTAETSFSIKVLLAEDNTVNQKIASLLLKRLGCSVNIANNGVEAVKALRLGEEYDLCLMDCHMPEMDGYEATQEIRKSHSDLKIIALTADVQKENKEKCLSAGMDDFLTKPIRKKDLETILSKYFGEFSTPEEIAS